MTEKEGNGKCCALEINAQILQSSAKFHANCDQPRNAWTKRAKTTEKTNNLKIFSYITIVLIFWNAYCQKVAFYR